MHSTSLHQRYDVQTLLHLLIELMHSSAYQQCINFTILEILEKGTFVNLLEVWQLSLSLYSYMVCKIVGNKFQANNRYFSATSLHCRQPSRLQLTLTALYSSGDRLTENIGAKKVLFSNLRLFPRIGLVSNFKWFEGVATI